MLNQPPRYGRTIPGKGRDLEEASLGVLHDLVGDALAWVDAHGALHPIGRSMEELLEELADDLKRKVRSVDDLPLDKEDAGALRALLASSEHRHEMVCAVRMHGETRYFRVRVALDLLQGGRFVALHDETRQRRAEAEALRLSRLRSIGALGAGIAQDLCELLASVGGMAEHLTERVTDAAERSFLDDSCAKAREGQRLLQVLVEMLLHAPCERRAIGLGELVGQALGLFEKSAELRGVDVDRRTPGADQLVRVVVADAVTALLRLLVTAARTQKRVTVACLGRTVPAPRPQLPARSYGVVEISLGRDAAPFLELEAACSDGQRGLAGRIARIAADRDGTFLALLALVAQGGRLTVEPQDDGSRHACLWLPAARARA
jgi:signal transduction histidine kinase